jgi:predicted ATPase/Tfp pilus assembly protein PilF
LAQEFAARHQEEFPGGVWFCELEGTRSRDDLLREVAATLTVPLLDDGDAAAQLGRALDSRGRVLVILDNLEQVIEDAHAVLSAWLRAAPEARFLATSRESLRIEGETVVTLDSLDLTSAVQLFEDRAGAVLSGFAVSPANRDTVEAIVERLDRLCLAIELAAARCSVLSPESLLEQLGQRFRLLKSNRRDLPPRQATIWGAIEWSWNLLEAWEAAALAQCSVFKGGFTLEAAEAVLDLSPWSDAPWILDVLQQLVEKSLLRRVPTNEGRERFGFYSAIQAFALGALQDEEAVRRPGGEVGNRSQVYRACRKRHARHYASFGSEASLSYQRTQEGVRCRRELSVERENLAEAVETGIEFGDPALAARAVTVLLTLAKGQGARLPAVEAGRRMTRLPDVEPLALARMMACLGYCLEHLGEGDEALDCVRKSLELASDGPPELRADLMVEQGGVEFLVVGWEQCVATLKRAERLCEEFNLEGVFCRLKALQSMGSSFYGQAGAAQLLEEAQALAEGQQDVLALEQIHRALGGHYHIQGEPEVALQHYRKSRDLALLAGDRRMAILADMHGALVHWGSGRLDEARSTFSEVLSYSVQTGDLATELIASVNLGYTLMLLGEFDEAEQVLLRAHELPPGNHSRAKAWVHHALGRVRLGQGRLDEAASELDQAEEVSLDCLQKHNRLRWLLARAQLDCLSGRLAASRTTLDEALRVLIDDRVLEVGVVLDAERVKGLVEARERAALP